MKEPQLFLHTGNRMEDLAGMLAEVLRRGKGEPFSTESVLVQSRGMGRWLSLQLADAQGICLNMRFPFPREVVEEILAALLPEWRRAPAFKRETMVWKIFRLLEVFRGDPHFRAIAHYLEGGDLLKRIQLAERVGNLFDQYLMYRPDWLVAWEKDDSPPDWQAILWRRLADEAAGEFHLGRAWKALRAMDGPGAGPQVPQFQELPPRLCVFGISSLPPFFLQVLRHYACFGELHLFLLQPTDQYWGDLVSRKKQAQLTERRALEPHFLEEGHPLVASWGRQGQDLLNLLIDSDVQQSEERECFREAEGGRLLLQLQADILHLTNRDQVNEEKIDVDEADESIQVHSCHSPMREVEVLHDQLLDHFRKDPTLRPRDILVMIPEIETYAPYIQAVFGAGEAGQRVPFSVVDRRPRSTYHAIDAWLRLLELGSGRFGARDVVSLLESPVFRARFDLKDREVDSLRAWIQATGIRWGVDAAHREEQGLPAVKETTWRNGIDQWLLGYAMKDDAFAGEADDFKELFPFDEIEGGNIQLLDTYLEVLDFLFRTRETLSKSRSLAQWCETFSELLDELFRGVEEVALEGEAIRSAVTALRDTADLANIEEPLPPEVMRYFLEKTIDDTVSSGGFLSGGVTFCTLQPMRTIPARVVCLLGMNDDAFPRHPQQIGFDKMRDDPRVGDRSVREDDRYLFLETLLSAREHLLISYVGQSARDLSDSPPSVLVSELIDHLDRACRFPVEQTAREFLVRRHRLQPFHPAYFGDGPLFSYSDENAEACGRLMGEREIPPSFLRGALSEPEPEWRTVTVQQLVRFFRNPAEYFIKERLGLRLPREEEMLDDTEMFEVNPLDKYSLRKSAVDGLVDQREMHEWQRLQAKGQAPLGTPGMATCRAIEDDAKRFFARLSGVVDPGATKSNRHLDLHLGDFHLRGELGPFFREHLVIYRPAKVKAKDCVAAWMQHLAACAVGGNTAGEFNSLPNTLLVGEDGVVTLPPQANAAESLERLLELYWRGLREPLPFFPAAAWTYCEQMHKKNDAEAARNAAWRTFSGTSYDRVRSESDDTFVSLCWSGRDRAETIGSEFEAIAKEVFVDVELFKVVNET